MKNAEYVVRLSDGARYTARACDCIAAARRAEVDTGETAVSVEYTGHPPIVISPRLNELIADRPGMLRKRDES